MANIRLQGEKEKAEGIYYEFDDSSRPLGEGGMGKVFRGRLVNSFTNVSRDVAIKFMFSGLSPNVIKRAEDEANIHILSDNLVEMMGFLTVKTKAPNGAEMVRYHVISELLIGVPLSDLMQGVVTDQNGVPIPYAQSLYKLYNENPEEFAVLIIKKVLSGIMALHDAGYIHRDIDPSNIMITRDEKIKLIDFGIAKKVDGLRTHDRNLTTAGQFMGKPQYAAPELIIGDIANQNKPTDIYAVGVLLYQLITGHLPFEGPANVVLNSHLRNKLPLKQIKDSKLRKVVEHATEKDCTKRYRSAAEFRADLDAYSSRGGSHNGGGSSVDMKKILTIGGAAVGAIVVVIAAWLIISNLKSSSPANEGNEVAQEQTVAAQTNEGAELRFNAVRSQLLNPSEAAEGFENLNKLVEGGNLPAKFTLSRIYAVSSGSFTLNDDFVNMQANLEKQVSPDPVKAHELLKEIVAADPKFYPALYELACDYYEGQPLSGNDSRNLAKAKELLDQAYQYANADDNVVYKNKISSLLRKY